MMSASVRNKLESDGDTAISENIKPRPRIVLVKENKENSVTVAKPTVEKVCRHSPAVSSKNSVKTNLKLTQAEVFR